MSSSWRQRGAYLEVATSLRTGLGDVVAEVTWYKVKKYGRMSVVRRILKMYEGFVERGRTGEREDGKRKGFYHMGWYFGVKI